MLLTPWSDEAGAGAHATNHDGWGFATIVTAIAGLLGAAVFSRRLQDRGSDQGVNGPPAKDSIHDS